MTGMADEQHTGGMIALIPSDPRALAITDGESADELHVTVLYLGGDVGSWLPEQREAVHDVVRLWAKVRYPIEARIFGHATFNPDGGPDGDRDPCLVYLVGDTSELGYLRAEVLASLREEIGDALLPQQHEPFVPHITAAYGRDLEYGLFTTGPVTFDRIRVALGDEVTDYPLGGGEMQADDAVTPEAVDDWLEEKAMSADPGAAELRRYWVAQYGKRWKKWRELRRLLGRHIKNPEWADGATTNIYRLATGRLPSRGKKSVGEFLSEAEIKAALALADPDSADFDLDLMAEWSDDEEDVGDGETDDAEELFEQALVDGVDWDIDAEGGLERSDEEDADDDEPVGPRTPMGVGPSLFDLYPE